MILLNELNNLNLLPLSKTLLALSLILSIFIALSTLTQIPSSLVLKGDLTSITDNEEGLILLSDLLLVVGGSSLFILGSLLTLLGLTLSFYFFYSLFS